MSACLTYVLTKQINLRSFLKKYILKPGYKGSVLERGGVWTGEDFVHGDVSTCVRKYKCKQKRVSCEGLACDPGSPFTGPWMVGCHLSYVTRHAQSSASSVAW